MAKTCRITVKPNKLLLLSSQLSFPNCHLPLYILSLFCCLSYRFIPSNNSRESCKNSFTFYKYFREKVIVNVMRNADRAVACANICFHLILMKALYFDSNIHEIFPLLLFCMCQIDFGFRVVSLY